MSVFTKAFYSTLSGDSTLAAMLSTYGGGAAVFTAMPIPSDVELPYIITEGEIGNLAFGTKVLNGREIIRDVRCYGEASGSAELIEDIAERVRALFHNQNIAVNGYNASFLTEAQNILTADEDGVYGRIVTVRMIVMEA